MDSTMQQGVQMDRELVERRLVDSTPTAGLSCAVAAERSARTAPVWSGQGTAVPFAGRSKVAYGARSTSLPGLLARGAPV